MGVLAATLLAATCALAASGAVAADAERALAAQARSIVGPGQGVYVETQDGTVLVAQAEAAAVHPASVSKIPTTLALLRRFGPEHRFITTFATSSPVSDGVLRGDLVVVGGGDPSFVDENALLVADKLSELGIQRILGTLRLRGPFTFDWQTDSDGERLRKALTGSISASALESVRALELGSGRIASLQPPTVPHRVGIQFMTAAADLEAPSSAERLLLVHRSQPLLSMAKSLNDYSNNIFNVLAEQAGGAPAVESVARSVVPEVMRSEITLGDGAGMDPRNRMSPRAAVRLLRALDEQLATTDHHLFDILPVAGLDNGTLHQRLNAPQEAGRVVGKTGTFADYGASALIGAIATRDRGTVYFAILNHGVPVPEARRRQDAFVRALLARLDSLPWEYRRDPRPDIARAEVSAE